jgi:ATP-dependent Clp protease protease subunit
MEPGSTLPLAGRMFERRVVFLTGPLDDTRASDVAMQLMALDALGDEPISLFLDSGEGTLDAAFALIGTIDLLGVPLHATCVGRAEGPAVGVLAAADHRRAGRTSRFTLSAPKVSVTGRAVDIDEEARRHVRDLDRFVRRLAESTGRPLEQVEADVEIGRHLDAREALAYGLIDEIWARDASPGDP